MGVRSDNFENKKMKKTMTSSRSNIKSGLNLSVTRSEIDKFWKMKKLVEEEHFLAAITSAATLPLSPKSKHFTECGENKGTTLSTGRNNQTSNMLSGFEITIGIKDWWTKSKYAYLNQPALGMLLYHLNH